MIVFRDHKQENKRKEMFHHCYMFAVIYDSSSPSWELRNSVLPMLFQSGNVEDVFTTTSTIQGCFFFLVNGLQFKHVNCTSSLHSGAEKFCTTHAFSSSFFFSFFFWKCERRAFDFYPYFHNSKMLFSAEWPSIQTFTSLTFTWK